MIELARHIEILLLDNDCVIVPGLGGFVTHHIPARRVDSECKFLPPYRTLGFSPKMVINDGLLVQSYMQAYDTTYPTAMRLVEKKVDELKATLAKDGLIKLHGIGTLRQNMKGDFTFIPLEAGLLSPSLYGFSSFEIKTLAELDAETPAKPAPIITQPSAAKPAAEENEHHAIVIRMERRWIAGISAACAGILLFIALAIPSTSGDMKQANFKTIVEWFNKANQQETITTVKMKPTTETVVKKETPQPAETQPVEVPQTESVENATPALTDEAINESYYTIVLASSITLKNANAYAQQMADKGYPESCVLTKDNLNRVIYARFNSESEAVNRLRELRQECENFAQSWVLRVK